MCISVTGPTHAVQDIDADQQNNQYMDQQPDNMCVRRFALRDYGLRQLLRTAEHSFAPLGGIGSGWG